MKTDNELIDEFQVSLGGEPTLPADLDFYEYSWDMLMSIVEKIQLLPDEDKYGWYFNDHWRKLSDLSIFTSRETIYKSVVAFIKWYYENKPK